MDKDHGINAKLFGHGWSFQHVPKSIILSNHLLLGLID